MSIPKPPPPPFCVTWTDWNKAKQHTQIWHFDDRAEAEAEAARHDGALLVDLADIRRRQAALHGRRLIDDDDLDDDEIDDDPEPT